MSTNNNGKFGKRLYVCFILLLIFISIIFFVLGKILNEEYFLKFSPDKTLKNTTLEKIKILQAFLLIFSTIILILILILIYKKSKTIVFINNHKKKMQNILLLTFVILFIFIISEISLKIIFGDETIGTGFGPGSIKFNQNYVNLNKDNMRERDFPIKKPENTLRIAGLGDSFTFGSGIKNINNTYLKLLEYKLSNQSNINYEILNFGIPGLDTEDELKILKEKALKYSPDIIILGYVLNDFKNIDDSININPHITLIPFLGFWLRNFLYSYSFIELKFNRMLENLNLKATNIESILIKLESEKNKEYNRELFRELAKASKENNIKVIVVIFPALSNLNNYPLSKLHNFVKQSAQENDFYFLDLLEDFKKYDESEIIISTYDSHPNELGHKIAADSIFNYLIENKIITI